MEILQNNGILLVSRSGAVAVLLTSIKVMIGSFSLLNMPSLPLFPSISTQPSGFLGDNFKWTQKMKRKSRKQNALM